MQAAITSGDVAEVSQLLRLECDRLTRAVHKLEESNEQLRDAMAAARARHGG